MPKRIEFTLTAEDGHNLKEPHFVEWDRANNQ
jgi:hypothetical protein